jgi:hypothetical protein
MRAQEFLNEAREASLYHFTSEPAFFRILSTDTLVSGGAKMRSGGIDPEGRIYFTRDYGRQFLPADILSGSWGFRVNQDRLRQRYGRKLVAGGQKNAWDEKRRQEWLADPANADDIAQVRAGKPSPRVVDGASVNDIVRGTISQSRRFESEEHLNVSNIPDFHEYITGIVYAGGKAHDPYRTQGISNKDIKFGRRNPRQAEALDDLAGLLMTHFQGEAGWKRRDALIEYMTKFNIPFVFQQQDFAARAVKQRMIDIWRERKAERARREAEPKQDFIIMRNPQGGGIMVSAPDWQTAVQRALTDERRSLPDGVFGVKPFKGEPVWFEQPVTQPGQEPKIANTAPESK